LADHLGISFYDVTPSHTPRRRVTKAREDAEQVDIVRPEPTSAELDAGYYRAGVDARRRAHIALGDVPGMVEDVEDRIEALLQRTLDLLGDEATPGVARVVTDDQRSANESDDVPDIKTRLSATSRQDVSTIGN
jgi:hypothetical protein